MKRFLLVVFAFLLMSSCFGAFYDGPRPPRKIRISNDDILSVAEKTTDLEVVVAEKALPITVFAAQELQQFLQKSLDTQIPVVNKPSADRISLIVGINEWSRQIGITGKEFIPEAFRILRKGRKIYIAGLDGELIPRTNQARKRPVPVAKALQSGYWLQYHDHGTLFGVYDFLERFAGVRFYFTGKYGTIVPRKKKIDLPGIDIYDRPDFQARWSDLYYGSGEDTKKIKSSNKTRLPLYVTPERNLAAWRYRMSTDTFSAMHGLNKVWLGERFGKDHPEYFTLRENKDRMIDVKKYDKFAPQICTESKVIDEIYLDAKAALTGLPPSARGISAPHWGPATVQKNIVNLSYNDGMYFCRCEKCLPVYKTKDAGKISTFLWKFHAEIARRLKEEKVPGYVCTLAYTTTKAVPDLPLTDNIVVDVSLNRSAYSFARSDRDRELQLNLIRSWKEKVGPDRIWFSGYIGKLGAQLIPTLPDFCHRAVGRFYSEISKHTNIGFQQCGGSENYLFNYLNRYLFFRMAWDKNCDWEKVLTEHYQLMFGKAAPVLENIYNELEDLWVKNITGKFVESNLGSIPIVPSDRDIWTKIYSPEVLKKLSAQFDKAEKMAAAEPDALERVKFIRSQLITPMLEQSATFLARSNDALGLRIELPTADEAIKLDGELNENSWKKAPLVTLRPFKFDAKKLYPATSAVMLEDAQYLYLGVRLAEPDAKLIANTPVRKLDDPDLWRDNLVEIFLKPENSGDIFYQLMVNLKGSIADLKIKSTGRTFRADYAWHSNARAAYKTVADGVVLEIRIPKSSVPGLDKNNFRFNLIRGRIVDSKTAMMSWTPFLKNRYHEPDAFGWVERKSEFKNIVKDHTFSTEITPHGKGKSAWHCVKKLWNTHDIVLDTNESILGGQSLRLTQTEKTGSYFSVSQDLPELKPNTRYRVSFYLKTKDIQVKSKTGGVGIGIRDNGNHWLPYNRIRGTHDWHYLSFDYTSSDTANTGKNRAAINCIMAGAKPGSMAWIDGVRIEELGTSWSNR